MKRLLAVLLLFAVAVPATCAYWIWRTLTAPVTPPPGGAIITISPGDPFRSVAERLQRAGLVRHAGLLAAWARYRGVDRQVRAGEYRISSPLTPLELLALLQLPSRTLRWVTIPEGWTAGQIAEILERDGFGGRDVFLCAMNDPELLQRYDLPATGVEGYLFPDTYAFEWAMSPGDVLGAMLDRFREESAALAERRRAAGLTEQEMVTLASVIEKETARADERPLISGVFHNRLRAGMLLQSDPTVLYALGPNGGRLTRADLAHPSPYNTYVHPGLPPGPIASPGRAALEAAIEPAATDAYYFVSRNDGSHQFSHSLDEHNDAVRKYQRGEGRTGERGGD
jgi:UPF0755 protein